MTKLKNILSFCVKNMSSIGRSLFIVCKKNEETCIRKYIALKIFFKGKKLLEKLTIGSYFFYKHNASQRLSNYRSDNIFLLRNGILYYTCE